MLSWLRRRRAASAIRAALVEADAADLIDRFGDRAYDVAWDRDRSERSSISLDGNRPAGHWSAVKRRIAASIGKTIGLDTFSRYLGRR